MSKMKEVIIPRFESNGMQKVWENRYRNTEDFVRKNLKILAYGAGAVVFLIALYFAYLNFYLAPRETEAKDQMFRAQSYFEVDSVDRAIKGDGSNPGFEGIISEYSGTKSANLAYFYLGSAYLRKGQYQKAIDALGSYHAKDDITGSEALGMTGDAYSELNNYDQASRYYEKAVNDKPNAFTSAMYLLKEGLVYEQLKNYPRALELYKRVRSEYSQSQQARDIEKFIARVEQH